MRKLFYFVVTLIVASVILSSCEDDDPKIPDIQVGFKFTPENPIAGEEITFTNSSNGGTNVEWDFGDGDVSTEANPKHTFTSDGSYTVVLMVDGYEELQYSKDVTVGKQTPSIETDLTLIQKLVPVKFTASIYNPDNKTVSWKWEFPAGKVANVGNATTLDENGVATVQVVDVVFTEPNETEGFAVKLTATIEGSDFETTSNIIVKNQLAKTLYFALKGGNIVYKKLYTSGEGLVEDTGIPSGSHALTLQFANNRLYVFDAGSTVSYSAAEEEVAGKIISFSHDGTDYKTHIAFGTQGYDDAFFGYVDDVNIYWTDRRNDITKIEVDAVDVEWNVTFATEEGGDVNPETVPRLVQNTELGYYSEYNPDGPNYGWGALNGTILKQDDVYWWAKNSNYKGIWRFTDSDIGVTDAVPANGALLTDHNVRAFAIDEVNQKIYFSDNFGADAGFYVADIDGSNITLIDNSMTDKEGGTNEPVFITGITVDNESGYVYWAYRGPALNADDSEIDYALNPLLKSGIKMFNLDGSSNRVYYFAKDVEAYGLALDDTKR